MSNIFGGNTGLTYDDIQRKRAVANSLLMQNAQTPRNVGEGLSAIGRALAARAIEKRTSRRDSELRAEANDTWGNVFSSLNQGTPFAPNATLPPKVSISNIEGQDIANDAMIALGKRSPYANAIASIESAGSGDYKAVGPETGKGRAYGRYQVMDFNIGPWTEKHYGQRLTPQQFLENPEAQEAVFSGEFGSYVEKYGNPQDAASMWFSGRPVSQAGNASDGHTTVPQYVSKFSSALGGQSGGMARDIGGIQAIAEAMGNPYISQDAGKMAVLNALLGQAFKQPQKPTSLQQNVEWLMSQGLPMEQALKMAKGGVTNNINNEAPVPKDHRAVRDENNNLVGYEVIPGSPTAREIEEQEAEAQAEQEMADKAAKSAAETEITQQSVVQNATKGIRDMIEGGGIFDMPEVGIIGNAISGVNQEARDMKGRIDTLKGMVAFDRLNEMKKASAVGASGLGALSERELDLLSAQLGALDQSLGKDVILETLDTIDDVFGKLSPEAQAYLTSKTDVTPQEAFQKFASDPENRAAAEKYGVSLEDMWNAR